MGRRIFYALALVSLLLSSASLILIDEHRISTHQVGVQGLGLTEEEVVEFVNGSRAYASGLELENISAKYPAFRAAGSEGAFEAADWIKGQFENLGLNVSLESFPFSNWTLLSEPTLVIDEDGNASTLGDQVPMLSFECEHMSWFTPDSGVFAKLVVLPLPEAASRSEVGLNPINMTRWNELDTTGKIVLIGREVRWSVSWQQEFVNKMSTQTPAAVVYSWWYSWMSFVPPFFSSSGGRPLGGFGPYYWDLHIPVGFVGYDDGSWIRSTANSESNLAANVKIRSVIATGQHYNVVGRIEGFKNPEKLVLVSGHYDTVMDSGFCDNGGGTAGIIELARVFTEAAEKGLYKPSYTLIFVAFTGEELDLVGSINYVAQHKDEMANITAVINLDCIGSDDLYVTETNPSNGFDLDETIIECANEMGINVTVEPPGGSDQEAFRIPYEVNDWYLWDWGLDPGISDATSVPSSVLLDSYPLFYDDLWTRGKAGWIHTSYDNSTSTATRGWMRPENLANHLKVATLTVMRIVPNAIVPPPPPNVTIVVPDNYTTIQEAINHANDNDTIFVRHGTYHECVLINKQLTMIGENRDTTIIDGDGNLTVLSLTATSNITGFTIRDGGYGIRAGSYSYQPQFTGHRIQDNRIINNYYGGIFLKGCANNTVADNVIVDNTLFGIHLWNTGNSNLTNNTVVNNGHGITFYGNTTYNILRNNNMTGNTYNFGLIMRGDTYSFLSIDSSKPGIINDVDTSNTINGKPIYCLNSRTDIEIPTDAGYVWLNNCTNVTIQGCDLSSNLQGILVLLSNSTTVANNSLVHNVHGAYVGFGSFNSSIMNNTVEDCFIGLYLGDFSAFTILRNNTIRGSEMNFGLPPYLPLLKDASDLINDIDTSNTVDGKPIIYWTNEHDRQVPKEAGYVMLINSTNILINDMNLTKNVQDVFLVASNNTLISNSSISCALYGIQAEPYERFYEGFPSTTYPCNTTIEENMISDNAVGIRVGGNNSTVRNNQILSNPLGIYFKKSDNGSISQNMIAGSGEAWIGPSNPDISPFNYSIWRREFSTELLQMNVGGIFVGGSWNTIFENSVCNSTVGMCIDTVYFPGSGNIFFNNNVYNNSFQQAVGWQGNIWYSGYPTGGNYWGNYGGIDQYSGPDQNVTGSDGIGDTTFGVFAGRLSVLDRYPLMAPISIFTQQATGGAGFDVKIMSNSTVSDVRFNETGKIINFNVTGETGVGFCRVTIPNAVIDEFWQGNLTVLVNGTPVVFNSSNDGNNTYLYFTYQHSTKTVTIVPELQSYAMLILLTFSSFLVLTVQKTSSRKRRHGCE